MARYAPASEDGTHPYVITRREWGNRSSVIKWASNLADAKKRYGWTRERHVSLSVRRATVEDMTTTGPA